MTTQYPHRAIGLITDSDLRAQVADLLPEYQITWGLALKGAIHKAADLRPSFMLVDIEDPNTHWREVVIALQSNPATRRIPMLGIAHAQNKDTLRATAAVKINGPLPRNLLPDRLPDWVARRARRWDAGYYATLATSCTDPLPELAQEGIRLFNEHDFWEAHEVLEHAWIDVRPAPIGELYRSILQIGVAYYQIQQENYMGAVKMFLRAVQWLDPLPETCQGVDVAQFKRDAAAARAHLEQLGAARIAEFDKTLFKPVPMVAER